MSTLWQRYLSAANGLKDRERWMILAALIALLFALTDALFISPLRAAHQTLTSQTAAHAEAIRNRAQEQVTAIQKVNNDPGLVAERAIQALQQQANNIDREIIALGQANQEHASLPAVLEKLLSRNSKVSLVRVQSSLLNAMPQAGSKMPEARPPASTAGSNARPDLQRRTLEFTLAGSYLDMMAYLQAVENALPALRWSTLKLSTANTPMQLTVSVLLVLPEQAS